MVTSSRRSLFHFIALVKPPPLPHSILYILPRLSSSKSSQNCISSASGKKSFTVNYLISNCGFSPDSALSVSERVRFATSAKPERVLTLFRNLGLTDSQLHRIISNRPWLLLCNPAKSILPKLEFFNSKGASSSDVVHILVRGPRILHRSLENHIIPMYDLLKGFLKTDKRTITSITRCPDIISGDFVGANVELLLGYGVLPSGIALLLIKSTRLFRFHGNHIKELADELKELGFNPSKLSFVHAFCAKYGLSKSLWEKKVKLYKRWGWSDEAINTAFLRQPCTMQISERKIEAVFEFFVNHLDWDPAVLARNPSLFTLSLEKRSIPRATVLQFLLSKGLVKNVSISYLFYQSEEMFLQKLVDRFKDDASEILRLYEEKKNASSLQAIWG